MKLVKLFCVLVGVVCWASLYAATPKPAVELMTVSDTPAGKRPKKQLTDEEKDFLKQLLEKYNLADKTRRGSWIEFIVKYCIDQAEFYPQRNTVMSEMRYVPALLELLLPRANREYVVRALQAVTEQISYYKGVIDMCKKGELADAANEKTNSRMLMQAFEPILKLLEEVAKFEKAPTTVML